MSLLAYSLGFFMVWLLVPVHVIDWRDLVSEISYNVSVAMLKPIRLLTHLLRYSLPLVEMCTLQSALPLKN